MHEAQKPSTKLLDVAFFDRRSDSEPKQERLPWESLRELLRTHSVRSAKDGRLYAPVRFRQGMKRSRAAVEAVTLASGDLDHRQDWKSTLGLLEGKEFIAYTTHSHKPEDPCLRVVLPLERPIPAHDWDRAWAGFRALLGGALDENCKDPSRMYYLPSHPPGAESFVTHGRGLWLKPEDLLELADARQGRRRGETPAALSPPELFEQVVKDMDAVGRHEAARRLTWELRRGGHARSVAEGFCDAFLAEALESGARMGKDHEFTRKEYMDLLEGAYAKAPALSAYPWTDSGNAERLLALHGEDLRFNLDARKWLVWSGRHWQSDEAGEVSRRARDVARQLYAEGECKKKDARTAEETKQADKLCEFARRCESRDRLKATLEVASWAHEGTAIQAAALDADPWLLNCANGAVDLRSGSLRAHRQEDLQSVLLPVEYDASATCPAFLRFLDDIFAGGEELAGWLQKAIGYSLTGSTREQVFFVLHGGGSNGKSTLLDLLAELFGEYHRKTPTSTLLEQAGDRIPNDVARLCGARMVTAEETTAGKRLAESLVKSMVGGDRLTARFLNCEYFEFKPSFKLWLACNHLPRIDGQDHAIWRRIRVVPFRVTFDEARAGAMPIDRELPSRLRLELPGILAWAVEGCLRWQVEGLRTCAAVNAATGHYRDTQDVLGEFLQECCLVEPRARVLARELHAAYTSWAIERGEKPVAQRSFTLRLEERGEFTSVKRDGLKLWKGIGLLADREPLEEKCESANSALVSGCASISSSSSWANPNQDTLSTSALSGSAQDEDCTHESAWL